MPATITRAWTHVKNFIERHALAFLTKRDTRQTDIQVS